MRSPEGLSYKIAIELFWQGMECDAASGAIARRLPALIREVVAEVKEMLGQNYMPEKESTFVHHMDHGAGSVTSGPDDPDCPCRTTNAESICAYIGCGFCRASQERKHREFGDA